MQRRRQLQRPGGDAGDRDVRRSRAMDVSGSDQGIVHAGRAALSVRQPAMSGGVCIVDVPRL